VYSVVSVVISLAPAGLFGATFTANASCSNFPFVFWLCSGPGVLTLPGVCPGGETLALRYEKASHFYHRPLHAPRR